MNLKKLLVAAIEALNGMSTLAEPDFRLEQAEYLQDKKVYEIVVSYLVENTNPKKSLIPNFDSQFQYARLYKKLRFDENFKLIGLYIYEEL